MNGVQDMGGMHGFGPVEPEENEPVFHHDWEGRVFGLNWAIMAAAGMSLDAGRAGIEQLPPAQYLGLSYYGRWFNALCASFVEAGIFSEDQVARIQDGQHLDLPAIAPGMEQTAPPSAYELAINGQPPWRQIEQPAAFSVGQSVRGRNLHPPGHTRLPRYVRGREGVVVADRGGHVFPDSNALGLGEDPHRLYAVRFTARELWGETANSKDSVTLDLWEPYLETA